MKRVLVFVLLAAAAAWADPEGNVYHTLSDPTWQITKIGQRWVIQDARGFFVGYYVPQQAPPVAKKQPEQSPPPAVAVPTSSAPVAQSDGASATNLNNEAYYNYNSGYQYYAAPGFYGNYRYYNQHNPCHPYNVNYSNPGIHHHCPPTPQCLPNHKEHSGTRLWQSTPIIFR